MHTGSSPLQLILLVSALSCFVLTRKEMHHAPMRLGRLAAPMVAAAVCALVFLVLEAGAGNPPWTNLAALTAGLGIGALRGWTLRFEVDHVLAVVRIPRSLGSIMVAVALVAAVLIDIASTFFGVAAASLRAIAADASGLCAGALIGRWTIVMLRWTREPHVDLREVSLEEASAGRT